MRDPPRGRNSAAIGGFSSLVGVVRWADKAQCHINCCLHSDNLKFKVRNMTHMALLIVPKNYAAWIKVAKPLRTRLLFVLPLHRGWTKLHVQCSTVNIIIIIITIIIHFIWRRLSSTQGHCTKQNQMTHSTIYCCKFVINANTPGWCIFFS